MTQHSIPAITASVREMLRRVASEVGGVAEGLTVLEAQVGALLSASTHVAFKHESMQAFDQINQHLRVLEAFLAEAANLASGEIVLNAALESVFLEGVRARLAGEECAAPAADDIEFW